MLSSRAFQFSIWLGLCHYQSKQTSLQCMFFSLPPLNVLFSFVRFILGRLLKFHQKNENKINKN